MSESNSQTLFQGFDAETFDDPEFKEDAVREEVIAPILRKLGYSASGLNRIVRSRALIHPFVMIGSQKRRINIIPDYLLLVDDRPVVVIDAKTPSEGILESEHVEQVYSYAIHPDVRAPIYALCNGRRLVVWDREHFDPILNLEFAAFEQKWDQLASVLSPESVLMPFMRDFLPDLGMALLRSGYIDLDCSWMEFPVTVITRVSDDLYSISSPLPSISLQTGYSEEYMVTLDLELQIFKELVNCLPAHAKEKAAASLTRQPYRVTFECPDTPTLAITARLGRRTQGEHEEFVPFIVTGVKPAISDPEAMVRWLLSRAKSL
jgi:hypothetical protein